MPDVLEYLEIRSPGDAKSIRRFIEKNRSLGIEGYERFAKDYDHAPSKLFFMLGHMDERTGKPVFVAGVSTVIFEFGDLVEDSLRRALGIERPRG